MGWLSGIFRQVAEPVKEIAAASAPAYKKFGSAIVTAAIVPETLPAAAAAAIAIPVAASVGVGLRHLSKRQQADKDTHKDNKTTNNKSNKKAGKPGPAA